MFGTLKRITASIALSVMACTGVAHAAFVTIDEAGLDAIFSQDSFGNRPIDIRVGAITEIVAPDLLDITTDAEIFELFGMHPSANNVANFYFVDTIDSCGGFNVNIIGCGELPGNDFVVESEFADSPFGAELLGHELAHNLGVPHSHDGSGLMGPAINGETDLTVAEVDIIHNSQLVQADGNGGWFIQIDPILILGEPVVMDPVPLPAAGLLLFGGIGALGLFCRKRKVA